MKKLERDFYERATLEVAKELLGKYLVHRTSSGELIGKIVETEAYRGPLDKAAHSYKGKTSRTEVMYKIGGHAYVYLIYGMYYCMNIVTERMDLPEAVLIRALEPINNLDQFALNRFQKKYEKLTKSQIKSLTNGPGKLCKAMEIDKTLNGIDLLGDTLYVTEGENISKDALITTTRVNIDYAEEAIHFPWRFYIKDNIYVSKK